MTPTTPLPSSCTVTVTVVSTLHAAASSMTANATRTSRIRLVLERCVAVEIGVIEPYSAEPLPASSTGGGSMPSMARKTISSSSRVDHDRLAGVELLPQDLLRERVLDHALDRTPQRPGAERGVVALRREQQLGVGA